METRRASCSTGRQAPDQAPAPEIVSPFKPGQVPGFFFSAYRKSRAAWSPGTWFPEWPPAWCSCAPGGAGNPSTGLVGLSQAAGRGRLTLNHCARYQLRAPGRSCAGRVPGRLVRSYCSCSYFHLVQLFELQLFDQVQLLPRRPGRPGAVIRDQVRPGGAARPWPAWCASWCRCLYVDTNKAPGVCMWMQTRCAAGRWAPAADQVQRAAIRAAWRVSGH